MLPLLEQKAKEKAQKISGIILKEKLFRISKIEKKTYNYEFVVANGNQKVKVQVYFGKKGVKTIIQGNKDSDLYQKINLLISDEPELTFKRKEIREPDEYIGTDESGKGDFFGPLVVAAAFVNKSTLQKLKQIGVKDSKQLNDSQILVLAKEIKSILKNSYSIVYIPPAKYNELYIKFRNLNKLLSWAHSKAIEDLLKKHKCSIVITDKFSNKELTITNNSENSHIEFLQFTKGERFTAVAAASILARNRMVQWFAEQEKKGLRLPKGASSEVETTARMIVNKSGQAVLENLVKLHFKTVKKL